MIDQSELLAGWETYCQVFSTEDGLTRLVTKTSVTPRRGADCAAVRECLLKLEPRRRPGFTRTTLLVSKDVVTRVQTAVWTDDEDAAADTPLIVPSGGPE